MQICVVCLNMYRGKYALICKFKYAAICNEYAAICSTKYAGICTNRQIRNMQYMCITRSNILKYAKENMDIFANIPCGICINMHKICTNMQNRICINMNFQICINMCLISPHGLGAKWDFEVWTYDSDMALL